jgi:DNA-directed RNA polymerase specialized sigma24 family protein
LGAEEDEAAFRRFVSVAEPRLRRALVAAYGPDRGLEATAEALGYAWEHWGKGQSLSNPCGYLYRVGQSRTRISKRRNLVSRAHEPEHWVEPRLGSALSALPKRQRVAVVLVFAAGFTPTEAAAILGVSASTVKTNTERGVAKLRRSLGVTVGDQ